MLDVCYSGDVCVLFGFFVGFLAPAADGMALPVVLRWYTGNQMRFGSRRPCERAPGYVLCVRVHGLSGQDGPRVRVPGTASPGGVS